MTKLMLGCATACLALSACNKTAPATATPPAAIVAPTAPAPAIDISGKWECMWNLNDGDGREVWTLMQDGKDLRVTLVGRDPGGRYTGSASGQIYGRDVKLDYKFHDGVHGTMTLKASGNGKVLDGESRRSRTDARPQHYACSRS